MKLLVNPLLWFLLLQIFSLYWLQRNRNGHGRALMIRVLLLATLLLTVLATPLVRKGLTSSLAISMPAGTSPPSFIFVLGGGYFAGAVPDEDLLIAESQRRVLHGITQWRLHPAARLVFSGAEYGYEGMRDSDRLATLMAQAASNRGVRATAIMLEPHSRNTREHPVEALKIPGVTAATPVAVVTSGWHMKRAHREFCRHFEKVQAFPVPEVERPLSWLDVIPDADTLDASAVLLREWAGMLWYQVTSPVAAPNKC